ncbi:MAG: hypothetical protein R3E97_03860 [Candidatus Eisenbacteria bacterium]
MDQREPDNLPVAVPSAGRRWTGIVLWILIPAVMLLVTEVAFRVLDEHSWARALWFEGVSDRMEAGERIDYLFFGSSRTANGLVASAFESEMESAAGDDVTCVNLGRAMSGAPAQYFGLRMLLEKHPEAMRNCTVSLEESAGLPEYSGTWDDAWFFPGATQLVVDYMERDDLTRYLETRAGFEAKAGVVARYYGRGLALIATRRQMQQRLEWRGQALVERVLTRLGAESAAANGELPTNRRLRVDAGGVRLMRDLVHERVSPEALAEQTPAGAWDDQVVCAAARMLEDAGVRVTFHEVPVPSYLWMVNDTEVRRADRESFLEWQHAVGVDEVRSTIEVTDEDFPDLSHLRKSRIEEYSRDLARGMMALP